MTLKKTFSVSFLVRLTGLEPAFLSKMEPKSIVYANFTTDAYSILGCALRFERRFYFTLR